MAWGYIWGHWDTDSYETQKIPIWQYQLTSHQQLALNNNNLCQTQISSSNFIIIHNQRKMEKSPPQKKKQNKRKVCTSEWLGP